MGWSYRPIFIEGGANRWRCSCWLFFNKKRVLIDGGIYVGNFSVEKECCASRKTNLNYKFQHDDKHVRESSFLLYLMRRSRVH